MKEIVFVTSNRGKLASAEKELEGIKVIGYNAHLIEPRSSDIKEISKQKVIQAYNYVKKPCIALDVGFFVEELNGFPEAYVNDMLDTIGINGLLKLMDGVNNRRAEFRHCLAFYDGEVFKYFEGKSVGTIATEIRGVDKEQKWSDLWYVYIPEWTNKTLAELSEKDHEQHRKNKKDVYMKEFAKWYKDK